MSWYNLLTSHVYNRTPQDLGIILLMQNTRPLSQRYTLFFHGYNDPNNYWEEVIVHTIDCNMAMFTSTKSI